MKITDLKCAIIGRNPVVRITTDEGIDGIGQAEPAKQDMKWLFLYYKDMIVGLDPTDVERVMQKIRPLGAFKPWGAGVSSIEMALWDIAGKAAGVPVYKLLGGKVRDRVRTYNGSVRRSMSDSQPEDYAEEMRWMKARPEGFSIIKQAISFHGQMVRDVPDYFYGEVNESGRDRNKGLITERGMKHTIACIEAMKDVLGDEVGLALDCGPGFGPTDALKLARSVEDLNVMWLEDMITGDYTPYVLADLYREVTPYTTTPIHTGEQIYLRQNFMGLIEKRAVNVIGPDLADVGGLAELKWISEYADMHGISIAPHGTFDGLIGLAAQVQVAATLPKNYIAFEYCIGDPDWWYDIVEGLPNPIVKDSFIDVWDTPGLGVTLIPEVTKQYLRDEDLDFFD
ncbi:MAG: mandelate racemase/muconate lactonizing enzyme family protein [Dehalococcoidia bacterium]